MAYPNQVWPNQSAPNQSASSALSGGGDHVSIDFKNWFKAIYDRRISLIIAKNIAARRDKIEKRIF